MRNVRIDYLLRVTISLVIVLATLLLDLGENTLGLTLITLGMTAVSAYVTDFKGWYSLSQRMANWLALLVVVVSAASAYYFGRQAQTFAVAHLQSYLQYVLLFQTKTTRVYWQLALLSVGQVAIASTLLSGPIFAVLFLAYLLVGIFTFALLLLQADVARFGASAGAADFPPAMPGVSASGAGIILLGSTAPADQRTLLGGAMRQSLLLSLAAVGIGSVLFFALPRWDVQRRLMANSEPVRTVGFSKTVTLGELGEVINNSDVVMRIQFLPGRGNRPIKLVGEPLFRGTSVTRYDRGSWTEAELRSLVVMSPDIKSPFVRQHITVEPLDVPELFCVFPVFAFQTDFRLRIDSGGEQLQRQEDERGGQLEFEIGTNGIVEDRQRTILPIEKGLPQYKLRRLLQLPAAGQARDPFVGLRALAAGVLERKGIDPATDRVAAARALSDYLSSSGRYFYSLEPQPRDQALDPLEDFVTRHPLGHCEYFAGALVLMLRSQGIPARMALGFKGGEWNPVGMYYQVQQLHAHAWVEVHLGEADIPEGEFADDERPDQAWLVLDPTEGAQASGATSRPSLLWAYLRQYVDYTQVLWTNYFVNLNSKRQRQGIYEPLAQGAVAAAENLFGPEVWQARFRALAESPVGTFWQWYRRHWFSWRGGLVAIGFSLCVMAISMAVRWLIRVLARWGLVGERVDGDEPPVLEMYRRFEAAVARIGLARAPSQTAHEFALAAGGELAEHVRFRRVAHLPRRIIEVFHRVRFGGRALDKQEAEAVEHALAELDRALAG